MDVVVDEHTAVVQVTGDIDVSTRAAFTRALSEALTYQRPLIVIDLRDAGCFGSAAISSLIPLTKDAAERGIRVELANPSPLTRQVIDLTRVAELTALSVTD